MHKSTFLFVFLLRQNSHPDTLIWGWLMIGAVKTSSTAGWSVSFLRPVWRTQLKHGEEQRWVRIHRASSDHTAIERLTHSNNSSVSSPNACLLSNIYELRDPWDGVSDHGACSVSIWLFLFHPLAAFWKISTPSNADPGLRKWREGEESRAAVIGSRSLRLLVNSWKLKNGEWATRPIRITSTGINILFLTWCCVWSAFCRNSAAFLSQAEPVEAELALVVSSPPPERPALHPALLSHHSIDHHLHHRQVQRHETHPLLKCVWTHFHFTAAHLCTRIIPSRCAVCFK